ncbi:uncharacterized protein LOC134264390 [Saccostrea cucullata]|uniref:uncharacterized protein LOC134264390 n=1 Tax=Saccostrea cuccullata TaxID=36930 RepID=UPI002ED62C30
MNGTRKEEENDSGHYVDIQNEYTDLSKEAGDNNSYAELKGMPSATSRNWEKREVTGKQINENNKCLKRLFLVLVFSIFISATCTIITLSYLQLSQISDKLRNNKQK